MKHGYAMMALEWVVVLFPGLFLYVLHREYRGILWGRYLDIKSIMSRGKTFATYLEAFGAGTADDKTLEKTLDNLFYRKHGRRKYLFPIAMNALGFGIFIAMVFLRLGFHMGFPDQAEQAIGKLPWDAIVGISGAFVWGIYDILSRYQAIELSPVDLHMVWLRMLIASILAPMLSKAFADTVKPIISFGIGAFPTKQLFEFAKGQAKDRLKLSGSEQPVEKPNLDKIQGLSEAMVDRLRNEGYETVAQLATADPIKLLLRTNIEWKTILDIIDQAILFDYFGDKAELLRPLGVRGAIELATIKEDLDSTDPTILQEAIKLVSSIAAKVKEDEAGIRNTIRNSYEDVQVEFLWNLWGDTEEEQRTRTAHA